MFYRYRCVICIIMFVWHSTLARTPNVCMCVCVCISACWATIQVLKLRSFTTRSFAFFSSFVLWQSHFSGSQFACRWHANINFITIFYFRSSGFHLAEGSSFNLWTFSNSFNKLLVLFVQGERFYSHVHSLLPFQLHFSFFERRV